MKSTKLIAGVAMAIGALALSAGLALAQDAASGAPAETAAPVAAEAAPAPAAEAAPATDATSAAPPAASVIGAPPEGKGQIVFFRPSRFAGGALTFTVREGETDLGRLPNGRYFVHVAEPGIHEYEVGRNDSMRMEIEAGETYYVQNNISMGFMAGRGNLAPSDQATFDGLDNLRNSAAPAAAQ